MSALSWILIYRLETLTDTPGRKGWLIAQGLCEKSLEFLIVTVGFGKHAFDMVGTIKGVEGRSSTSAFSVGDEVERVLVADAGIVRAMEYLDGAMPDGSDTIGGRDCH